MATKPTKTKKADFKILPIATAMWAGSSGGSIEPPTPQFELATGVHRLPLSNSAPAAKRQVFCDPPGEWRDVYDNV